MFVSQSDAVVLLPGGFGTMDECFETITLIQTGKATTVPVVMIEPPGRTYWEAWDRYVRDCLLADGLISDDDLNLYKIVRDPAEAVQHVLNFYRNYHSQRIHQDDFVIRMQRPLTSKQVDALNDEFGSLVAEGRITPCSALEGEKEYLELPRLRFVYTRRDYGTLRLLIDRINEFDADNHS